MANRPPRQKTATDLLMEKQRATTTPLPGQLAVPTTGVQDVPKDYVYTISFDAAKTAPAPDPDTVLTNRIVNAVVAQKRHDNRRSRIIADAVAQAKSILGIDDSDLSHDQELTELAKKELG